MPEAAEARVVVSNEPGSFAHSVLAERHPALIQRVRDAFPYGPQEQDALDALLSEISTGVIEPLGAAAHDRGRWQRWGREHFGQSWFDAPFLWAESYFYRRLLEAVGYFTEGPWRGIDPFQPFKTADLTAPGAGDGLAALDQLALRPPAEQARALTYGSLWGNRADLGFRLTGPPAAPERAGAAGAPVIRDDTDALWALLPAGGGATVYVVADNAGQELVPDLLLIDHLLRHGHAARVVLHVKPYPYYVSDAMPADALACLRHLLGSPGAAGEAGKRLWAAMGAGRLGIRAHSFSCAPLPYAGMPDDLRRDFAGATVTVLKGDLNYRRLVGDRLWPPTTSFAERTAYFPSPVAALRTLKSDVIVGLDPRTEAALDVGGQRWRTSGTHAVIQVRP